MMGIAKSETFTSFATLNKALLFLIKFFVIVLLFVINHLKTIKSIAIVS